MHSTSRICRKLVTIGSLGAAGVLAVVGFAPTALAGANPVPTLSLSTTSAHSGQSVTISGTGCSGTQDAAVTVYAHYGTSNQTSVETLGPLPISGSGTFSVSDYFTTGPGLAFQDGDVVTFVASCPSFSETTSTPVALTLTAAVAPTTTTTMVAPTTTVARPTTTVAHVAQAPAAVQTPAQPTYTG